MKVWSWRCSMAAGSRFGWLNQRVPFLVPHPTSIQLLRAEDFFFQAKIFYLTMYLHFGFYPWNAFQGQLGIAIAIRSKVQFCASLPHLESAMKLVVEPCVANKDVANKDSIPYFHGNYGRYTTSPLGYATLGFSHWADRSMTVSILEASWMPLASQVEFWQHHSPCREWIRGRLRFGEVCIHGRKDGSNTCQNGRVGY